MNLTVIREVRLAGGAMACMAVTTPLGAEFSTHTTWTIFWPLLFLFAFSAASGEIANGIFFFANVAFPSG
jgi:hypothetical protein